MHHGNEPRQNDRLTLGERVRRRRREIGATQEEVSRWFGVNQSTIALWERGHPIAGDRLVRVAEFLGSSHDEVLTSRFLHPDHPMANPAFELDDEYAARRDVERRLGLLPGPCCGSSRARRIPRCSHRRSHVTDTARSRTPSTRCVRRPNSGSASESGTADSSRTTMTSRTAGGSNSSPIRRPVSGNGVCVVTARRWRADSTTPWS